MICIKVKYYLRVIDSISPAGCTFFPVLKIFFYVYICHICNFSLTFTNVFTRILKADSLHDSLFGKILLIYLYLKKLFKIIN